LRGGDPEKHLVRADDIRDHGWFSSVWKKQSDGVEVEKKNGRGKFAGGQNGLSLKRERVVTRLGDA